MTEDYAKVVEQSYNSSPKYSQILAGLPEDYKDIQTLGDLIAINYKLIGVKDQLRQNLVFLNFLLTKTFFELITKFFKKLLIL